VVTVSTAAAPPPGNSPAYAMNGTIRREGDKIKVIVRLTNERSGITLWSNDYTYDAALIARVPHLAAVESSMVVRCGLFGASTYSKPLPDNVLVPYLGYCQGTDGPEAPKALNFAQKVVALAPDFSWGWSGVAVAASGSWLDGGGTDDNLHRQALDSADRAIELDPSNSEAYSYKALLIERNDLIGQEKLFKKALAARPLSCGCEHHLYAVFLFETGRIRDSIAEFRHGITVLPLSENTQVSLGNALLYTGDVDGAKAAFDAAADLDSDVTARRQLAVQAAPFDRDFAGAATIVFDPKVPAPKVFRDAIGGGFAALASGSADAKMKAVGRLTAAPLMNADVQLNLLALLGAPKIALQKIDGSANQGIGYYRGMLWLPSMRSALRDPSFSAMAERLGLTHYWKTTHTRPDVCSANDPPPFCRMI
jgi:tetratricopeptide (TPR) repeat protein